MSKVRNPPLTSALPAGRRRPTMSRPARSVAWPPGEIHIAPPPPRQISLVPLLGVRATLASDLCSNAHPPGQSSDSRRRNDCIAHQCKSLATSKAANREEGVSVRPMHACASPPLRPACDSPRSLESESARRPCIPQRERGAPALVPFASGTIHPEIVAAVHFSAASMPRASSPSAEALGYHPTSRVNPAPTTRTKWQG